MALVAGVGVISPLLERVAMIEQTRFDDSKGIGVLERLSRLEARSEEWANARDERHDLEQRVRALEMGGRAT